jgi:hypothetical protein
MQLIADLIGPVAAGIARAEQAPIESRRRRQV